MPLGTVKIGDLAVSRMIIGGNPFSGFSHQSPERDDQMRHYYTVARIKETLQRAEMLGINTHISRADHFVMRYLMEYWDEGGTIQWFAQTCPELGPIDRGIDNAVRGGAKACYVHGGVMDNLLATGKLDQAPPAIARIRAAGLAAGVAGHNVKVFEWAEKNLDCDFYMCSYYNPTMRDKCPEHPAGAVEVFDPADRDRMAETIRGLSRPAIHYKVLAAGRNDPREALRFVARHMRPQDAVCLGFFTKEFPTSIEDDLRMLKQALKM